MQRRTQIWLAGLLAAGMLGPGLVGCESNQPQSGSPVSDVLAQTEPVEILNRLHGDDEEALANPQSKLIKSREQLDELGVGLGRDVDFSNRDMIILALGEQNTGGYWARINSVQRVGDTLYIQSTVNRPGQDGMASQQITYPYAAVVIPETEAARLRTGTDPVTGQARPQSPTGATPSPDAADDQQPSDPPMGEQSPAEPSSAME